MRQVRLSCVPAVDMEFVENNQKLLNGQFSVFWNIFNEIWQHKNRRRETRMNKLCQIPLLPLLYRNHKMWSPVDGPLGCIKITDFSYLYRKFQVSRLLQTIRPGYDILQIIVQPPIEVKNFHRFTQTQCKKPKLKISWCFEILFKNNENLTKSLKKRVFL